MNNSFREIAEQLYKADNILLFPHVGMDGDCVGSCAALCRALRLMGKNCYAIFEDEMPANLMFMTIPYEMRDRSLTENDMERFYEAGNDGNAQPYFRSDFDVIPREKIGLAVAVDCGEYKRFPEREEVFRAAPVAVCIDHHGTSIRRKPVSGEAGHETATAATGREYGIGDYNYIDPKAAAAGVPVYRVINELNELCDVKFLPDKEIGEAVFAAITTDTGNFQYANTDKECFEVMTEIFDWGIDANAVSVEIYENIRPEKLKIENCALDRMEVFAGGRAAVCYVTRKDMEDCNTKAGETDGIVQALRSVRGVEVACFVKEKEHKVIRVSLRSKHYMDVAEIAGKFDGGGHVKAAGCTLLMDAADAVDVMKAAIEEAFEKRDKEADF